MANIYYRLITGGAFTPEQVPLRWREAVRALLGAADGREEYSDET